MVVRKNNAQLKKKNSSRQRTTQRYVIMMSMKDNYNYLDDIPDEYLAALAEYDWEGLEVFCMLLSLDNQIQLEGTDQVKLPS